jgi:Domain of unknown function (DUF4270)
LQKRFLPTAFLAASLLVVGYSCTKFDTTTQGADLVTVDNINTFQRELDVVATQGIFDNTNDSTILAKTENHVIGGISDPQFGTTDARIYVQFKPNFYPFYFGASGDTVKNGTIGQSSPFAGLDSAFVCLSYRGVWGDSSSVALQQTFELNSIDTLTSNFRDKTDTLRRLDYKPNVLSASLGSATITPQIIASKVTFGRGVFKDSVVNQIRIKLTTPAGLAFAKSLFEQDSSSSSAFNSDEKFRKYYGGFEIKATSLTGNTLYYVNLAEAKTRLEFHYRKTKNGIRDTVVQSFQMYPRATGTALASPSANFVKRNYGLLLPPVNNTTTDVFLQTAPGTFANLSIPSLDLFNDTNRIIHRAYLIVEQNPSGAVTDNYYTPPPYLYLDLKDTVNTIPQRYKPIPFDLSNQYFYNPDATGINSLYHPFPNGNIDLNNFGGAALKRFDGANTFYRYEINITRYVQHIVTNGYKNYDLRLFAPFNYFYPQYEGLKYVIPFYNPLALGRVKVGTGTNTNNHKMRLVIVYSKV